MHDGRIIHNYCVYIAPGNCCFFDCGHPKIVADFWPQPRIHLHIGHNHCGFRILGYLDLISRAAESYNLEDDSPRKKPQLTRNEMRRANTVNEAVCRSSGLDFTYRSKQGIMKRPKSHTLISSLMKNWMSRPTCAIFFASKHYDIVFCFTHLDLPIDTVMI